MSMIVQVSALGEARLVSERERMDQILARATPPETVAEIIPVAPARGAAMAETPADCPDGPKRIRVADAFSIMEVRARAGFKGDPAEFVPPFTPGQIQCARDYAALTERVAASGLKCSSPETLADGSGPKGLTVSEAVARDIRRLRAFHARIGNGVVRDKVRPSKGGVSGVRLRYFVDQVCLSEMTVGKFLKANGYPANKRVSALFRSELGAALDRMRGYDVVSTLQGG